MGAVEGVSYRTSTSLSKDIVLCDGRKGAGVAAKKQKKKNKKKKNT